MSLYAKPFLLALALGTVLLAGCLDEEDPAPTQGPAGPMSAGWIDTWQNESFSGMLPAPDPALFAVGMGCVVLFEGLEGVHHAWHAFTPNNSTSMAHLELAFTHAGPEVPTPVATVPDMDLLVYDPEGNLVQDSGEDPANECGAASQENPEVFEARLTEDGEYRLLVVNFGSVQADYDLTVSLRYQTEANATA